MIKEEIYKINGIIVSLGLFTRWGGYSINKNDAANGIPYGVSIMKDCYGNTYTYDDRAETVGYMSIERFQSSTNNRLLISLPISYKIHIFNTLSKSGETQKFWQKGIIILKELKKIYHDVNIETVVTKMPDKVEYCIVTIRENYIVPCDYNPDELDALCDGTGLIDVCDPLPQPIVLRNLSKHITGTGNFDISDPFNNSTLPSHGNNKDTVIVKFDDGLGFYTHNGTTWIFNYFQAASTGSSLWEYETANTIKPQNGKLVNTVHLTGVINGGLFQP
jgi:hypothetical protein